MTIISIIGATLHGNHGAEAMLAATIARIRARVEGAEFSVFSYYPREDRRLISDPKVSVYSATPISIAFVLFPLALLLASLRLVGLGCLRRLFPAAIRALGGSAVMVDVAGVSFIDGREKFLPFNILTILPAMLLHVPVVKFAQAMGPFNDPINRMAARIFLTRCIRVFGRGEQTMKHLRTIGFPPERFSRAADMAFLLEEQDGLGSTSRDYTNELINKLGALKTSRYFIIGICPSSVLYNEHGYDYITRLADFVADQLAAGNAILLYPNATRADRPDKLFNNDLPLIKKIYSALPSGCDHTSIIDVDRDIFAVDLKRLVAFCDMVVVSRFHAMIAALAAGVPPLVLGWSHKYAEVMDDFEIGEEAFNFDMRDDIDLSAEVVDMRARLDVVRARISDNLNRVRALSTTQIEYVVAYLD
jgi:colanic acid/amylovoran biosynthesis protein